MYVKNNDNFYYLTLMNENYLHPSRPKTATDQAILNGAYLFKKTTKPNVRLLASGVTLRFAEKAAKILKSFDVNCDLWSITSFNELAREGLSSERKELNGEKSEKAYVEKCFEKEIPTLAVSEYQRLYAEQIRRWVNGKYICLGTDGFGRSDTREKLRDFFEIDHTHIVYYALIIANKNKEAIQFANENKLDLKRENPWQI